MVDIKNKLISIVMPVKNAEPFLIECIESILNQTEANWELIAVNDHSSDSSKQILTDFAKKDQRIRVIDNIGEGIIPALKTAYKNISGNFISRMDADDRMPQNKLKVLKEILLKSGKGYVATGKVSYFSADELSEGFKKYEEWLNLMCDNQTHWNEIYKECVVPSPCWMAYRSDFNKCGGFDSTIYPEDYDLVFRFYKANFTVLPSQEILHYWRDHSKRASRNDPNYRENNFFKLKLEYFFELSKDPNRPLVIWGAGKKGKQLAKLLKEKNSEFRWVSNNPNKHGVEIYQHLLESFETIIKENKSQIIISVAQKNAKEEITKFLSTLDYSEGIDYFFFN